LQWFPTKTETIESHWSVGEIAAELKKYAKSFPGSIYVKDSRKGNFLEG